VPSEKTALDGGQFKETISAGASHPQLKTPSNNGKHNGSDRDLIYGSRINEGSQSPFKFQTADRLK